MAGILTATPPSTGGGDPASSPPAKPQTPAPGQPPPAPPQNTLSMNNPLANAMGFQPQNAPSMHSNEAINQALMEAFRPIVPDQINSLLGPAIGAIQGRVAPIAYYQPRPAAQIAVKRSS